MADYDNSGVLGRNRNKKTDRSPEFNGQATVEGKKYWLSAWVKDGKDGSKYFSLAFSPQEDKHPSKKEEPYENADIPF